MGFEYSAISTPTYPLLCHAFFKVDRKLFALKISGAKIARRNFCTLFTSQLNARAMMINVMITLGHAEIAGSACYQQS
jgi:hypothetical protein